MEPQRAVDLRGVGSNGKAKIGSSHSVMVRKLDADGMMDQTISMMGPDGRLRIIPTREAYVDAEQLVEMIRQVVREEVERALRPADV